MKKAGLAIKYLLALFPSVVTLTMIVVGIISFPVSLISNLDLVSSEIIIIVLMLICGVRFFRSGISKQWQVLYWFTSILTIFLFFVWSKRAILIQPLQITVPLVLFEKNLQNLRKYINDNISAFFWLNVYDSIFICLNFLVGTNKHISENIQKILVPLNIPISYADAVLGAFFLFFWLLLAPVFRSWFGIHFFRKQNPISLPADRVLWGTYLLGYFLSLAILTIYINTYFTISQINSNPIFIMLVYTIYLSSNVFLWNPVYVSLINLGENKDKLISNWILSSLILVLLVLVDQVESDTIGILTWFLPILLPNFIGELYKISDKYQRGEKVSHSLKMEKHLYHLTMISFNTLLIFNIISIISVTDEGEHKFKQFVISTLSGLLKTDSSSGVVLSLFSSLIMVLFSLFLAWWLSKGIVKLLKNIYLDPSKGYFN